MIIFLKPKYLRAIETIKRTIVQKEFPLMMISTKLGISIKDVQTLIRAAGFDAEKLMSKERDEFKDSFGKWQQKSRLAWHDSLRAERTRCELI